MPTKAGMVKASDIVNGKTFYEVQVEIDHNGNLKTKTKKVFITSRVRRKEQKKELKSNGKFFGLFGLVFDRPRARSKDKKVIAGTTWFYQYSKVFSKNIIAWQWRRLFTTLSHAERFERRILQEFTPSEEQKNFAIKYHRFNKM